MNDYYTGLDGKQHKTRTLEELKKDIEKMHALHIHEWAHDEQTTYNLPYRVLHDYYSRDRKDNEVQINLFYPLPEVPKEGVWDYEKDGGYTFEQWMIVRLKDTGERTPDGKKKCIWETPRAIQEKIAAKAKPFRKWDLETEQGRQKWFYYFMVFLMPYEDDIPHWSVFDMFGDIQHTEQELKERQRYFLALIEKAKESPELYKHDIAVKGEY